MAVILNPRRIAELDNDDSDAVQESSTNSSSSDIARDSLECPIKFVPAFDLLEQSESRAGCSKEEMTAIAAALLETLSRDKHKLESTWIFESRRAGLR